MPYWLVHGAVKLASLLGISQMVIGLTVVAMGTSAPEMAASIASALKDSGNIAIGNVYGSNISNLALIGGICAIIAPITVRVRMLKREIPVMIGSGLLLLAALYNAYLSRIEAAVFLIIFAGLLAGAVYWAKKESRGSTEPVDSPDSSIVKSVIFVLAGLAGLSIGAKLTLDGAVFLGERIGFSEAVIGLTIIAVGTSLPELMTCVAASLKGHNDILMGNLVGSNIFNTLLITSGAGLARPFSISDRLTGTDYWIMIAVSVIFAVMAFTGKRIRRTEGVLLVMIYIGYMVYVVGFSAGS